MDVLMTELRRRNGSLGQAEAAELIGTSTRRLREIVLDRTGKSFRVLRLRVRLGCAKDLLDQGLSIEKVCERLEYSTRDKLERAFKRQYGMSPSQYRTPRLRKTFEETATQGIDNVSDIGYCSPNKIEQGDAS